MTKDFKPTLYLKASCPHCFKLRLFLLEAGLIDTVNFAVFSPGTPEEETTRAILQPHFEKTTFPSAEVAPGVFKKDSDALIDLFAAKHSADKNNLPTLQAYIEGPFKRVGELFRENRALKEQAS